tara:strand:+ start:170 stop:448 length:279 start_codon:yes stop_codon:yes gene_type:complete
MIKLKKSKSNYDHSKIGNDIEACSIDLNAFKASNVVMDRFMDEMNPDLNLVSQLAECVEETFTKEHLAFMVSKLSLVMMMAQSKSDANNEEE